MTFPPDDPWGTSAPAPAGPPSTPGGPLPGFPPHPGFPPAPGAQPPAPLPPSAGPGPQVPDGSAPVASGPVIVQIAEIEITSSLIRTPAGDFPLAGSRWQINEFWVTQRRTPLWAKIVGVAGICVTAGLSLFLLMVKESAPQGTATVTVTSGPQQYVARIPVHDEGAVITINQQVNYVRSLAAL